MREIKFRQPIWNAGKVIGFKEWGWIDGTYVAPWDTQSDAVNLQATGLKDKNRKDIYEGHVVRHRSNGGAWSSPAEVKWRGTAFELATVPMRNIVFSRTEIEVIGNVYENPGLLA